MPRQARVGTEPSFPILHPGQRVRLRPPLMEIELTSPLGTVVRPDVDDGHYVIHLDEPATYYPGGVRRGGDCEVVGEIVEASDNLDAMP